jgi:hypothetical protein
MFYHSESTLSKHAILHAVKGDGAEMLGAAPDGDVHEIKLVAVGGLAKF